MVKKIFFSILFLSLIQSYSLGIEPLKPKTDELAVDFSLSDLNGREASLSDFKDKPIILFFWTTWCAFCRKELKILNDMYPQLLKEGLELLAIDVGEPAYRVDNFVKRYSLNFKILLDKDTNVSDSYDVLGVPTYVLINKKGYIVFKGHHFPEDSYKDLISK